MESSTSRISENESNFTQQFNQTELCTQGNEQLEAVFRNYESKREETYKELEIAFVQNNIRCKLLKRKQGIEFLFFNGIDTMVDNIDDLISESAASGEVVNDDAVTSGEVVNDDAVTSGETMDEEENAIDEESIEKSDAQAQHTTGGLCAYLDLEAECSEDVDEEESGDEDLVDIIDNTVANTINLEHFVNERAAAEECELMKLKQKFLRKSSGGLQPGAKRFEDGSEIELLDIESNDEFPEIKDLDVPVDSDVVEEDIFEKQKFTAADLNKKMKIGDTKLFNDERLALHRLGRDEGQKNTGFVPKENKN